MCLYPKFILNKKYMPTRKNGYNPPTPKDPRTLHVPVGCGVCIECMKQKARAWQARMNEEIKAHNNCKFVTLTFSPEALDKLCKEYKLQECNAVAGKAVRLFMERWRKYYGHPPKHWLITELGHEGTERIHLHGILFLDGQIQTESIERLWGYGIIYVGDYCNARTINYIVKYVTKIDTDHKNYRAQIFASAGIGRNYITEQTKQYHTTKRDFYRLPNGAKINMPIYYRNKFFSEEQREQLWLERLDQHTRYVMGAKIANVDCEQGERLYMSVLRTAQKDNEAMGYGTDGKEWKEQPYNITMRMLNKSAARGETMQIVEPNKAKKS